MESPVQTLKDAGGMANNVDLIRLLLQERAWEQSDLGLHCLPSLNSKNLRSLQYNHTVGIT